MRCASRLRSFSVVRILVVTLAPAFVLPSCGSDRTAPRAPDSGEPSDAGPGTDGGPRGCVASENMAHDEDEDPWPFQRPAAMFDSAGVLHVAYGATLAGAPVARYTSWTASGGWVAPETIAPAGASDFHIAIALDASGSLHVAFVSPEERIIHATRSSPGTWAADDLQHAESGEAELAIGADGVVHIAFETDPVDTTRAQSSVAYARGDGGSWTFETVEDAWVTYDIDLDLDPDGVPHITFFDNRHAERAATGTWTVEDLTALGVPSGPHAIDTAGTEHILSGREPLDHWARPRGGAWARVETAAERGSEARLRWTGDGYATYEVDTGTLDGADLYLARYEGGAWSSTKIDRVFIPPERAIAASPAGELHAVAPWVHYTWCR